MKNRYIFILIILLFSSSCVKDNNDLFDKSPDKRLTEKINEYYNILSEAPNGWIMTIDTKVGGVYRLWVNFKDNNRVEMLCDMDATWKTKEATSSVVKESSFKIKAMQYPTLIFDTYNYIHLMADPQGKDSEYGNINGGVNGAGLESDFEFALGTYENNIISLKGRYNSVVASLEKATEAQENAAKLGGLKDVHTKLNNYFLAVKYPVIEINGVKVDIVVGNRNTNFSYLSQDKMITQNCSSYPDLSSFTDAKASSNIHFINPIEVNGVEINGFTFDENGYFSYDGKTNKYIYDNKKPSVPLRFGYNLDYTSMIIDDTKLEGTLVNPFLADVYLASRTGLYGNGKRNMQYANIAFKLNALSGEPVMEFTIRYNNTAGSNYTATWRYKYRMEENGNITFYEREQTGSSNERGQEPYLRPLVDYFCKLTYSTYSTASWASTVISSVTPVTFIIDWGENNTVGSSDVIGSLIPVDNPNSFCSGILSK